VLIDTRRLEDCFPAVDYFEEADLPFVVAMNCFDGSAAHSPEAVREALGISGDTPIILVDARDRDSTKSALIELVQHALSRASV
jgi:signal recognition particle receptor subunit beta